jgi:hypothetical protein
MWLVHRTPAPGIDVLTSAPALEAFAGRQGDARNTIQTLGLDQGRAVLIGGAGLALHGLNSYVDTGDRREPFDVDACVDETLFTDLRDFSGSFVRPDVPDVRAEEVHVPATDRTLAVSGIRPPYHEGFVESFGARTFADLGARAINVDGVLTLPATELVRGKLHRGEPKDLAGVLQAHLVAWETDHSIVQDERWQWGIIGASHSVERRAASRRDFRRALPSWLGPLVASGFNHPAFTSLHPDPMALRHAS